VIHDLNRNPILLFPGKSFDVVVNTVSVDYMTRPMEVFQEAGRILKPGGLFLVSFSNRMFPEKTVKIWRESSEEERVILVEEFFEATGLFEKPRVFVSKGKPRPKDDKYARLHIPSDPVYAVYSDRRGGDAGRKKRPALTMHFGPSLNPEELEERKKKIKGNFCCPYCGERMNKWAVPENPFAYTW
jgi:SAM-dependent methyltransferase